MRCSISCRRLPAGVLIHVHDCPFPFEYPKKWVFDLNYSWNEVYALRAFLMYNKRFSIEFWNSYLARNYRAKLEGDFGDFSAQCRQLDLAEKPSCLTQRTGQAIPQAMIKEIHVPEIVGTRRTPPLTFIHIPKTGGERDPGSPA